MSVGAAEFDVGKGDVAVSQFQRMNDSRPSASAMRARKWGRARYASNSLTCATNATPFLCAAAKHCYTEGKPLAAWVMGFPLRGSRLQ